MPDDATWRRRSKTLDVPSRRRLGTGPLLGWRAAFISPAFVASTSVVAFGAAGLWMALFLKEQHGFTPAEYGSFHIRWGLVGVTGICFAGWFIGKLGRRLGFAFMPIPATIRMTVWVYNPEHAGKQPKAIAV